MPSADDRPTKGGGRIVTLSSGGAVWVLPDRAAYAVPKAGLIGLTKAAAMEGARNGVTANVIAPGLTDTAMAASVYGNRQGAQLRVRLRVPPIPWVFS